MKTRREAHIKHLMWRYDWTEEKATTAWLEFEKFELEKELHKPNANVESVKREIAKIDSQINFIETRGLPKNMFEQMIFMTGRDINEIESMAKK